ncbi:MULTISPECIES: type II CAAX endopeptidase family protein [unclassified Roseitalea]|uniref:CPBP family intramembrane glutamic endopeptidase n=1 Tax=unclassified Roseitalea TaxID=2639107 RepID=UPI00273EC857|nr:MULTISPECIES: type II CAAX endopeptidase family protein [unclassified Roseitalea]
MAYVRVCLFMALLPVPLAAIEWAFAASGSGLSLLDTSGAGQITLYVAILLSIVAFQRLVARDRPFGYLVHYLRHWRRGLGGFVAMAAFTFGVAAVFLSAVGLTGHLTISPEALARLDAAVMFATVIAIPIAFVLAFAEELIFRAFLLRYLRWNTTMPVTVGAVGFSSLVFALSHNLASPFSWLTADQGLLFVGLFVLGVVLSIAYLATGSLLCSTGIHAGLLMVEVTRRTTDLLVVVPGHWLAGVGQDVRMAPLSWLMFAGLGAIVLALRRPLARRFAIERPVVSRGLVRAP